jgi:hypothetical protein
VVDQSSNIFYVTYKPGAHFESSVLRDAAGLVEARLPLIQIRARGYILQEAAKRYLVAGPDRFLLIEPPASAPPLPEPSDALLSVIASVDDSADPTQLKIVQSERVEPQPARE